MVNTNRIKTLQSQYHGLNND